MAKLKDKVQDALDENRMMVLGVQVLIGFGFRTPFETLFEQMPRAAQLLQLVALAVLLVTLALLLTPGADHRLCERGTDTPQFHRFATGFASVALFPFAVALGLEAAVAALRFHSVAGAIAAGIGVAGVALFMWYGIELVFRPSENRRRALAAREDDSQTGIRDKIRHVLTEARVVLPGVQALLGFQFVTMLMEAFEKLPRGVKVVHLSSLGCMALAIILLMTPAAWHRIVERGEESERMHKVSSGMVVAALVPIALGLSGDFFVVLYKVLESYTIAIGAAIALFIVFIGLWFGLTLGRRLAGAGRRATA